LLAIAAVAVVLAIVLGLAFLREGGRRRLFPLLRPVYKRVLNPKALREAAAGETRWAVLHHVGRRSGVAYNTPVDAQRTTNGVVIPLVYGPAADWCRNILAAGRCTLTLDGEELALTAPEVVDMKVAETLLSPERARTWRSIGIEHCLFLRPPHTQVHNLSCV
jgi:deazaflavin-dependent oxidoreductase (nitroreductase family)